MHWTNICSKGKGCTRASDGLVAFLSSYLPRYMIRIWAK
jgi:hypothetical protein